MCGIFGALGSDSNFVRSKADKIHSNLKHRGPDDTGLEFGRGFTLGFNRLSILDLSMNGHQPMYDATGRYLIVFNGEIYNYKSLKKEEFSSTQFNGHSDTEVLLNLLIKYGEKAIPKLNGMFAFCFVDTKKGEFILCRDRFGIKPLYYLIKGGTLFFASELKAFREFPELNWDVNEESLFEYLGKGYITNSKSIYSDWSKLLPAHYLKGNLNSIDATFRSNKYWNLPLNRPYSKSYNEAIEELETLLIDAVKIRLQSDVPVGIFLSGGIDSGLVAALSQKVHPVKCYTITYQDKEFDESELAGLTARHIGAEHELIELENIVDTDINTLAWVYDEPFSDSSALPSNQVCSAGSKKATVFLTGDAGDEAFGGYKRYINRLRHESTLRKLDFMHAFGGLQSFVPLKYEIKFHKLTSPQPMRDAYYDEIPGNPRQSRLLKAKYQSIFRNSFSGLMVDHGNVTLNQQLFDYDHYLPNDILLKMDRASMSNSIEVRSPFLDYRIHEFAAGLPRQWLLDASSGKKILRDLSKKYLPPEVTTAKKRGFGIPIGEWTKNSDYLGRLYDRMQNSPTIEKYFDQSSILKCIDNHKKGKVDNGSLIWRISMLLEWEHKNNR